MGKIVTREELAKIVADLKNQGKKIVTTNGTFDLMHIGHVRALQQAKLFGDILIVGVNSDSSVKQYKGDKRPVIPEKERAEMIASISCVDYVTIFSEKDPRALLEIVKPNFHVKSGDWAPEKMIETEIVRKNGGEVKIVPFIGNFSTTNIIHKIREVYKDTP
jgi:rfaE bifunctional protein nucleotidyltransferase chain/domain